MNACFRCSLQRMDKKGGDNDVINPDIIFCVDGFEEISN
jgi:hypothetical protein